MNELMQIIAIKKNDVKSNSVFNKQWVKWRFMLLVLHERPFEREIQLYIAAPVSTRMSPDLKLRV